VLLIQQGARSGAAKLWYDKPHERCSLLVSVESAVPDPQSRRLSSSSAAWAWTSANASSPWPQTGRTTCTAFPGKAVRAIADH
jgi:putative transposase